MNVNEILQAFKAGSLSEEDAESAISDRYFRSIGHSTVDVDRSRRTGSHEVIYGEFKTPAQIADLVDVMHDSDQNVMVTRTTAQA